MEGVLSKFRNLDAYPKVNEDFFRRSISGGIITIVSSIIMLCLFISELSECSATRLNDFCCHNDCRPLMAILYKDTDKDCL